MAISVARFSQLLALALVGAVVSPMAAIPGPAGENQKQSSKPGIKEAILTAKDAAARISLRAFPRVDAKYLGYGVVGDRVKILQQIKGQDGYNWYQVKFSRSGAMGWIRSDFVSTAVSISSPTKPSPKVCQGKGTVAFEGQTKTYQLYLCNDRDVNHYVSYQRKDNSLGVVIICGNGWVPGYKDALCAGATKGEYQYIFTPTQLVVTRNNQIILKEPMVRFNRFQR